MNDKRSNALLAFLRRPMPRRLLGLPKRLPSGLARLHAAALRALLAREAPHAKAKVARLQQRWPQASAHELASQLVQEKKNLAGLVGGVAGGMGLLGIPVDAAAMAWLKARLLAEVACLFHVNLNAPRAAQQTMQLIQHRDGLHLLGRLLPKILAGLSALPSRPLRAFGLSRALPLLSVPLSAAFNHHHLHCFGQEAIRRYAGFPLAHLKLQQLLNEK